MTNAATQMAAMSAAMRTLLTGHPLAKPDNLLIAASDEVTAPIIEMMMSHASRRQSTFLVIFHVENDTALFDRVMIVDGSTSQGDVNICGGKFVQKPDGKFAILSIARDKPFEYCLSHGGRRLVRRALNDDNNRAVMELRGLQALIAKAGTPACQEEARTASIKHC